MSLVPALALLATLSPQGADRVEKLSGSLDSLYVSGDVGDFVTSADGAWVVYRAQQDDSLFGLFGVPSDGSLPPLRITQPGVHVDACRISADGARVVFQSQNRLYRVGASGTPVALTAPVAAGGSLGAFALAPDGQRAVVLADPAGDGSVELYSVNLFGAPSPVLLSDPLVVTASVSSFEIAADSTTVVYQAGTSPSRLFASPLDGSGPPLDLCGTIVGNGVAFVTGGRAYRVHSGLGRVVYRATQLTASKTELFAVPLDASAAPVRLNPALVTGGNVTHFELSSDGTRAVYLADQTVNNRFDLHTVATDGLSAAQQVNGAEWRVTVARLSPDGARVAYVASPGGDQYDQVYTAPADASQAATQVSAQPTTGTRHAIVDLAFTLDSDRVLYRAGAFEELYRVPADGGAAPVALNAPLGLQERVAAFLLDADGNRLVYQTMRPDETHELYALTLDGVQPPARLHPALPGGSDAEDAWLAGGRVFFLADLALAGAVELQVAPLDASADPLRLNGPLATTPLETDVTAFALAPDDGSVVYATTTEVRRVPLAVPGEARLLHRPQASPGFYSDLAFTPDASRVLFKGMGAAGTHLFSAAAAGEESTVQLSTGFFAEGGVGLYRLDPSGAHALVEQFDYFGPLGTVSIATDGSTPPAGFSPSSNFDRQFLPASARVLYIFRSADPFSNPNETHLYRQELAGGSTPVELAPYSFLEARSALDIAATPDETWLLFVRDDEVAGKAELYRVPVDGSLAPVKLSGAMDDDRDVLSVTLTPDGTRALFVSDRDANDAYELHVVPVDGSAAPLSLSGPMVAGGDVAFQAPATPLLWLTPDGTRVLYLADQEVDERLDLWSVPVDGSAAPARLSDLAASGDVSNRLDAVRVLDDGSRVVFLADAVVDGRLELFVAPVDASAPAAAVSGALSGSQRVQAGFLVLDGHEAVLYSADTNAGRQELWLAPLDGSRAARRRSVLAHALAGVLPDFRVSSDERWIYYRADAEVDERVELYRIPVELPPRARRR